MDSRLLAQHFIADTPRFFGIKRFADERPFELLRLNIVDGIPPRNQRDDISASPLDFSLIPTKEYLLHSIIETNVNRGKSWIGEQRNIAEGLIEPAAQCCDDHNLPRP